MTTFSGTVKRTLINQGSKSEHVAIVLDTGDGKLRPLRLRGHNALFDYTPFQPFVGWVVELKGEPMGASSSLMVDTVADITKKHGSWPKPGPGPKP